MLGLFPPDLTLIRISWNRILVPFELVQNTKLLLLWQLSKKAPSLFWELSCVLSSMMSSIVSFHTFYQIDIRITPVYPSPINWSCRIHQLHLCRGVRLLPPLNISWIWHQIIWWWGSSPGALGNVEYSFIAVTYSSTLTQSDSTC